MEVRSAAFPGRCIARGGSNLWLTRRPDLTPHDSFFWAYVKIYVYMKTLRDLNRMKGRTREAAGQATRDILQRAWKEVGY
jgi:hypothetical protein